MATSGTFPIVVTGTWGSKDGVTKWKLPDDLYKITKINIAVGEYGINSIRFTYKDNYGGTQTTDKYGGDGGKDYTITIGEDEEITRISGTFGEHENVTVIKSLAFDTNQQTNGPFGPKDGTSFSLGLAKGKFFGFYGTYGNYLESFGATLKPHGY